MTEQRRSLGKHRSGWVNNGEISIVIRSKMISIQRCSWNTHQMMNRRHSHECRRSRIGMHHPWIRDVHRWGIEVTEKQSLLQQRVFRCEWPTVGFAEDRSVDGASGVVDDNEERSMQLWTSWLWSSSVAKKGSYWPGPLEMVECDEPISHLRKSTSSSSDCPRRELLSDEFIGGRMSLIVIDLSSEEFRSRVTASPAPLLSNLVWAVFSSSAITCGEGVRPGNCILITIGAVRTNGGWTTVESVAASSLSSDCCRRWSSAVARVDESTGSASNVGKAEGKT